jgi:acetylornithine deacetylase
MRPDVVSLTERLVRVDSSPGRSTGPIVALLADELASLGGAVQVQVGRLDGVEQQNLVVRFGGDGPAGLVLAGHVDTVPWASGQRATTAPERDGRTLYGRGTCDMKGAVAAQLEAAASLQEKLSRPLLLAWTYAEEVGCHGAVQLIESPLLGDLAGAVCLVGEPTDLTPITAHKGYGAVLIELHGEPVHSSDPWAGADASMALGTLLRDLHELREMLHREGPVGSPHQPPCTTLNTGLVNAGSATNVLPGLAQVTLEFRPLPGSDLDELRRRITACAELACVSVPGVRCELHWEPIRPPFEQSHSHPFVQWLTESTGHPAGAVPFYTEAELYRGGLGVPTAVCGPGSIRQAHRVDESVGFEALAAGQAFYESAIRNFCC